MIAQVCKKSDLALNLAIAMMMIFSFLTFLAYLVPIFASLSVSALCVLPLWAVEYVANIVTGSVKLKVYFISSIKLLCRSCYVGNMIAFIAAVLSLNTWTLLKDHRVGRGVIYFKLRSSASTSSMIICEVIWYWFG